MRIPWWQPLLGEEEARRVAEVIGEGFPNDGAATEAFAEAIAGLAGTRYGIGVSSGSAAIYCALAACDVGPDDEVIIPDLTFVATANAVALTGATPVLVDIRLPDLGLDPQAVRDALSPRTKAIVPVHVNGRGAALEAVIAVAHEHGVAVVEDASEALSSRFGGRALGSFGDAGCFSFAPTKIITTGQGGVVVTDDESLARRVRQLKDQGRAERGTGGADEHPVFGFNFKLTNLNAAVGNAQLERLAPRLRHLRELRTWYEEELHGLEPAVVLPPVDLDGGEALAWIDAYAEERDELIGHLAARGIECREFWHPVHAHPPYEDDHDRYPNAVWASAHGFWLPSAFSLTREDIAEVGREVRAFVAAPVAR